MSPIWTSHVTTGEAAQIGDFRELDLSRTAADAALKVCCWLNTLEKQVFVP